MVDLDGVSTISANELTLTGSKMIDARRERAEAQSQYRQVQALNGDLERLASVPAVLGHPLIQQFKPNARVPRPRWMNFRGATAPSTRR